MDFLTRILGYLKSYWVKAYPWILFCFNLIVSIVSFCFLVVAVVGHIALVCFLIYEWPIGFLLVVVLPTTFLVACGFGR